jgi:nucleotide-binding universal stress UspA family protein
MSDSQTWLKKRLKTILLATDLHQNSKLALSYAANLAHFFGSKLRSLYVFEYGPYGQSVEAIDQVPSNDRKVAQESLDKFVAEAGYSDLLSEVVVEETFVTIAIIKVLVERDVDLLVIGTEGLHTGINHLLLGSNTEALMLGSQKLILTVGPQVPEVLERDIHFKRVIYISDFSIASTAAATYALALGEAFGVKTEIYQLASKAAIQDPPTLKRAAALYSNLLRFADPHLPKTWYDVDFQLSKIVSEDELRGITSEPSNLIVLGVQPASFLQRHLRTSLAYRLLAGARSPVLTVPANSAVIDIEGVR